MSTNLAKIKTTITKVSRELLLGELEHSHTARWNL